MLLSTGMVCRAVLFLLYLLLSAPVYSGTASAADQPFTYPSNWGATGLMEIPTARVLDDGSYRLGISQIDPYRYYYGAVSPFRGLEVGGRITEIKGTEIQGATWEGYGNYKDKAIDLKYQLFPEGKYMPAFALGIMDPHGTRLYSSNYLVLSKQIYPFDFSFGLGNERFGKSSFSPSDDNKFQMFSDPGGWADDSQFFWGIQFAPSEKLALMLEYNPIRYHLQTQDPAHGDYFENPVPSRYNVGLRYKPAKWTEIALSYQRGNRFGLNASMAFDIGNPLIPMYNPVFTKAPVGIVSLEERLAWMLYRSGFSSIRVDVNGHNIRIEARNDKFFYNTAAIGKVLEIVERVLPPHFNEVRIVLIDKGIPLVELRALRADIHELSEERLTLDEFLMLSELGTDIDRVSGSAASYTKRLTFGLKPDFETFLNDPSGFFKYRLGIMAWLDYRLWKGASLISGIATYPINNISSVNEPLSIPVRSDLVRYKQEEFALDRLMFDQTARIIPGLYGRVGAGLLEVQYGGIDAELAVPLFKGRILVGAGGSVVKKRDPDSPLGFKENDVKDQYTTYFLNTRLNLPEEEVMLDLKAGQFLAGDRGFRITLSKHIGSVTLLAWYSLTDTSVFSDDFNDGYRDKGIGVMIPIRLFKGTDSKSVYSYKLSPWTRDTGQDIEHFNSLFDFIGRNAKVFLDKDESIMYR